MTSAIQQDCFTEEAPGCARDKVASVQELARAAAYYRAQGHTVVLAHGVFDLVHMGHVRHLEAARAEGDILFVTVTPDQFVNKGPGRPVFPEHFRAEMLAALECVQGVAVNRWPSAENTIELIRPDVYVKGQDYAGQSPDITGKISPERQAVEAHGGRIVFTDDITFSSSSLINRHLHAFEPRVEAYLTRLREREALGSALSAIEGIADMRVMLVGDAIIDEYQYAEPMGKSAKENIIASRFAGSEVFAGGVVAAANHVASFCREVKVVTCLGEQDSYENLIRESLKPNIDVEFLFRSGAPTTRKSRFVAPGHLRKLFEVYFFDETPLEGAVEQRLCDAIAASAGDVDVVIVTDFGHGMMTPKAIATVTETAPFLAVNAQSNSANLGYNLITKYPRADYICIDGPEARLAVHDKFSELSTIVSGPLRKVVDCERIIVTHGERGCIAHAATNGIHEIPAFTSQVVDTVGAGDAFLSVTSPIVASGVDIEIAGFIGNAVGAMKVGIVGHRESVEKIPLMKYCTALLK